MKKKYVLILVLTICASILASACSSGGTGATTTSTTAAVSTTAGTSGPTTTAKPFYVNAPGVFPIVNEKITLTVMIPGNARIENIATAEYTKFLEEKTNIKTEWTVLAETGFQDQMNLALASKDLPDILMNMALSAEQQMVYGEQGLFASFSEYIDDWGDNILTIFDETPGARDAITAPGGKIYALPVFNDCFHCQHNMKMFVYTPWLTKLGIKEPTTLEEFRQMLIAFKTKDPNGNGKPDEIPLIGSPTGNRTLIDPFIMNSFIYDDGGKRMLVTNKKIDVVYNKPEWKAGLTYLNGLYKEGLISEQSFTMDAATLKKVAENPDVAIAGAIPAHSMSTITIIDNPSKRWLDYQPIAPLIGPTGKRLSFWNPYDKVRGGIFAMTSANEHPEATMRWADFQYEFENALRSNYGTEGKSWEKAKPGQTGRDGKTPAYWNLLVPFGRVQNESWAQMGLSNKSDKYYWAGQAMDPGKIITEKLYYDYTIAKYTPYVPDLNTLVPPLFFPSADSKTLANIDKTINDYVSSMIARFITGDASLEKDWDTYVKTLDSMGLKNYLSIYQKAYDEKMK